MKFQFKIQSYQTEAVEAVVGVFSGQPNGGRTDYVVDRGRKQANDGQRELEFDDVGYRNADITLSAEQLLANLHDVQRRHGIALSNEVDSRLGRCALDIEMETGTGKTYVYTKTMFELNRHYGWTKFVVVVPSVAIREGVRKSLQMTEDHFMQQYGRRLRSFVYSSDNLQEIDHYSRSADIQVMVINMQAFNKSFDKENKNKVSLVIYDRRDEFGSRRPIDVISANRPIVILDEPQKMGGRRTQTALKAFRPLFTLNYSATHRETHNPVFQLDALDAYNRRLVKKIEVVGFELKNLQGTSSYLYLEGIELSTDRAPLARIHYETKLKTGSIKRTVKRFGVKDDLKTASGLETYRGFVVTEINPRRARVTFLNGVQIGVGEVYGDVTDEQKARIQIRQTIKAHLRKENRLFSRGIKTLSLFFIDEVARYRQYDDDGRQLTGLYGRMFEEEYKAIVSDSLSLYEPAYSAYLQGIAAEQTHTGYFSIDKRGRAVDSSTKRGSDVSDDTSAYDLILKNKERLLSFSEPVRFIFSHSALREGWDNPNVFQICSLRQASGTVQKRQEVGRGLRICVNSEGRRMDSEVLGERVHDINRLTVIASEGYASFVDGLQKEISADLYERPKYANVEYFNGKTLTLADGTTHTITINEAALIYAGLIGKGYIDSEGTPTETFRTQADQGTLQPLTGALQPMTTAVYQAVRAIYDSSVPSDMIERAPEAVVRDNRPNENFHKREFQALWQRLNHMYAYRVSFDSAELIDKAVAHIDRELHVSKLYYVVERGEQTAGTTVEQIDAGEAFTARERQTEYVCVSNVSTVRYDLLGKIAEGTKLTRHTVATILSRISPQKFAMYQYNPEAFIAQTTRLILEQKATMIVEHIAYNRVDGSFSNDIFTEQHDDYRRAYTARKSVTPYVFCDGVAEESKERQFLRELEKATEVVVYAKLPRGFYIPTPVGHYSPDWAIAFREGTVKHVYFVAETKGAMSTLQLRGAEDSKIACARKLFETLLGREGVAYEKVDDFEKLMGIVR